MKVLSISCANCAAPLKVPARASLYLTCNHCGSTLELHHEDDVSYSTVLRKVAAEVAEIRNDVEALQLKQELAQLEVEWGLSRELFLRRDQHGNLEEPRESLWSAKMTVVASIVILVIESLMFANRNSRLDPFSLTLLILAPIAVCGGGFFMILRLQKKIGDYDAVKRHFEVRRKKLQARLRQVEG